MSSAGRPRQSRIAMAARALAAAALVAMATAAADRPSAPAAPAAAAAGAPSLGMGLSGIADWSTQRPFIDLMKSARPWTGHRPGQWGGWDHDVLAAGGFLDAEGWPTAVPAALTAVETLILSEEPAAAVSAAGRYRLSYAGTGTITVSGGVRNVVRRLGEIRFDYIPGMGAVAIRITATDLRGTGDYLRDIVVVKEEHAELHAAGAIFNPDWVARVADLRAVRFMDWMATNNSKVAAWSARPRVHDYTYARRGVPVEVMVALANEIGADPWFTMPHRADDGYMRRFAEYVRDHLDPRLRAHVEYSNEVWNFQFRQAAWAQAAAHARWGADAPGWGQWLQFAGMRAARMARIWDEVFGAAAEDRLVKVISTQTGWLGLEAALLEAPLWVAEDPARNRPPASYFDAYGVTGYFGYELGSDPMAASVKDWIALSRAAAGADAAALGLGGPARDAHMRAHAFDAAVGRAGSALRGSLSRLLRELLPYHAEVAAAHGLQLIMYEGGTHVVGVGGWSEDAELTGFFTHLNYTPAMAQLHATLLEGWKALGGTLFNAFVDVAAPSRWGSWGALRHLDDDNPRWDALDAFNRRTAAWWDDRPAAAFAQGRIVAGGEGGETLRGTAEEDILLGRSGDDLLVGGGGADRLHGGAGVDSALLPGAAADYAFAPEQQRAVDAGAVLAHGPAGVTRLVDVETVRFADTPGPGLALRAAEASR